MFRLFRFGVSIMVAVCLVSTSFAYANSDSNEQLWMQATSNTRAGITDLQNQIAASRQQQSQQQAQNQLIQQRALELLAAQQKAMLDNTRQSISTTSTGPEFNPQPRETQTTNNPWLKQNPWKNTQENPYSGQQYGSQPKETQNTGNGIYVKPSDNENDSQSSSKPVNIFQ